MADIQLQLEAYRQTIHTSLQDFLKSKESEYSPFYWGADVLARLQTYALRGKLLRGSMVLMAYQFFGGKQVSDILPAATAIELIQSGLLIHDDIIDRDELRRGQPALHTQYHLQAESNHYQSPDHQGQSLAICVGDITFFMSFELMQNVVVSPDQRRLVNTLLARELAQVGLAEMQDVHQALTSSDITEADILFLYRYKTGRYTFSLPLMMGAMLAGTTEKTLRQLEKLGEVLGLIFQLKDDELGLFGSQVELGKPVTSDIREGKKTLYYLYAQTLATAEERQYLNQWFGNPEVTTAEAEKVKNIVIKSGARDQVEQKINNLHQEAADMINQLDLQPEQQKIWQEFVDYNLLRRR